MIERRLLIISCSERKKSMEGKAIEVYDGPVYKILRNIPERQRDFDILIISAKYGLIYPTTFISPYNLKMTSLIAERMKKDVTEKLLNILRDKNYSDVYVELGKIYQEAVDLNKIREVKSDVKIDDGSIGMRLHNLKKWITSSMESHNDCLIDE